MYIKYHKSQINNVNNINSHIICNFTITCAPGYEVGCTKPNVPHVYYMYDTHAIHVWCFMCITHLIPTLVKHM